MPSSLLKAVLTNNAFNAAYATGQFVDDRTSDRKTAAEAAKKAKITSHPRMTVKEASWARSLPVRPQSTKKKTKETGRKTEETVSESEHDDDAMQDADMQEAGMQDSGAYSGGMHDHWDVEDDGDFTIF